MGTNYYFRVKGADKIIDNVRKCSKFITHETLDYIESDLNKIHICKISGGWKPLFRATEHYCNVELLDNFYHDNKDGLEIVNEYGYILTWEKFRKTIVNQNKNGKTAKESFKELNDDNFYMDYAGYEWYDGEFW